MKKPHHDKKMLRKFFGVKGRVVAVIEIGCSPSNKREQTVNNKNYLVDTLNSAGFYPDVHTGACCFNGCMLAGEGLDFTIRHRRVPEAVCGEWRNEFLAYLRGKSDKSVQEYLEKLDACRYEFSCESIYDMITQKNRRQKLANVSGYSAQFINRKVIEKNLTGTDGYAEEMRITPLKFTIGNVPVYVSDKQIDVVASFSSEGQYGIFLSNLAKDKDIQLWVNQSRL